MRIPAKTQDVRDCKAVFIGRRKQPMVGFHGRLQLLVVFGCAL